MTVQIVTVALNIPGFVLLSLLLLKIQTTSEDGRHPLFINFLVTWVMYSAFTTYYLLAIFTIPQLDQRAPGYIVIMGTQFDIFTAMTLVSTCNLVIFFWLRVVAWNSPSNAPGYLDKYGTPILLATPYVAGLVPVLKLLSFISDDIVSYIFEAVVILTTVIDVLLFIMLLRHHRLVRLAVGRGLVPLDVLIKLLVFSVFRTLICAISIAVSVVNNRVAYGNINELPATGTLTKTLFISQSLYPLLIFVLFGLNGDMWSSWFPYIPPWAARRTTTTSLEPTPTVSGAFTSNGAVVLDARPVGHGPASFDNTADVWPNTHVVTDRKSSIELTEIPA